jgi:hypothetical protein
VVRSTWDYVGRRDEYVAWAHRVERTTRLANPAAVVEWNTDKTYLGRLSSAGLPVVTTDWLEPGDRFRPPVSGEYVVKPAVSAGSLDTNRYRAGEHDALALAHVTALLAAGRTVMVQPYLEAVDTAGETALLYLGDELSHAIRKAPLLTAAMPAVQGPYKEETITVREPSPQERAVAEEVLDALGETGPRSRSELLYARVDLVPGPDGSPVVLELELAEPSLFLQYDGAGGAAAGRFARAIAAALPS